MFIVQLALIPCQSFDALAAETAGRIRTLSACLGMTATIALAALVPIYQLVLAVLLL